MPGLSVVFAVADTVGLGAVVPALAGLTLLAVDRGFCGVLAVSVTGRSTGGWLKAAAGEPNRLTTTKQKRSRTMGVLVIKEAVRLIKCSTVHAYR